MSVNKILPLIGIAVLLGALALALKTRRPPPPAPRPAKTPEAPAPAADSPADTVRSLTARVTDMLAENKRINEENERLRKQLEEFRQDEEKIAAKVKKKLAGELSKVRQENQDKLSTLAEKLNQLKESFSKQSSDKLAIGGGDIPDGFGFSNAIHWVEPLGAATQPAGMKQSRNGSLLHPDGDEKTASKSAAAPPQKPAPPVLPKPVYTIPAGATLMNSTTFTALIGRIPIGGQVQDPVKFKILIGRDNLAANGHFIPGLLGMVVVGTAVGDWNLACVYGTIHYALFVFEDGHVQVFGAPALRATPMPVNGRLNQRTNTMINQPRLQLGWISDRFGNCIPGRRVTNAPAYLAARVGLMGAAAAAEAAAAAQTTQTTSAVGGVSQSTVTGKQGRFILGRMASGGIREIDRYLQERMGQSFDAIYVPIGKNVAVHLDVSLLVDYRPNGRMLDHRAQYQSGGNHDWLD
ncbi:MAG TPA: TIGR03752 family integrating conjugative element protein [Rhodobacteraceae bacterium]|nr:TIGR03752 family integrating conjugative element protein [Paracoccaceae bacterium]